MSVNDEPVFLASHTIIEPLVDRFPAWLHLVAPAPAAVNLARVQVPLLESYRPDPSAHTAAGGSRRMEVAALLDSIKRDRSDMLAFADAIAEADELLRENAGTSDLTPLYPRLPLPLHGLVELAYGTGHRPGLRFLEPLLYAGPAYDPGRQSIRLSLDTGAPRPFRPGAPRLPGPDTLDLPIPFAHPGIDELFAARLAPSTMSRLREALELDEAGTAQLWKLLTDRPGPAPDRRIETGGRLRYFGHACLVMQSPEATVVTDPFISADHRAGDRYTFDDLPDHLDLVLLTQGRPDHVVLETMLPLRRRIGAVVVPRASRGNLFDPSIGLCLKALGFTVLEVDDFDEVPIPGGSVVATPFLGGHSGLDVRAKSTYFVRIADAGIYVGADSSGVDPVVYRHIRGRVGRVDMAFLGLRSVVAPPAEATPGQAACPVAGRMSSDAKQAAAVMDELGTDEAYVYAMGEESWLGHVTAGAYSRDAYELKQVEEFLTWCSASGITAGRLRDKREWRW
jgi:L-ascorbate metabolism protein UlaG (beta-lactamase superfamily)